MRKIPINRIKSPIALMAVVLGIIGIGYSMMLPSYAASGSLSLNPGSGSYNVGDTFNVDIVENGASATTVQAQVQFPSSLQFISDTTVAPLSFNPSGTDTASGGSVTITRSELGGSGSGTVTTLTFKVLSAGSATVSFAASPNSYILPSGCGSISCSVLTSAPSSTYTLTQPASPPPPSNNPPPAFGPSPVTAPAPTTGNTKNTSINVSTTGSGKGSSGTGSSTTQQSSSGGSSVTVPNNGSVAVTSPVSVQPSSVQMTGISKVQYYLGNKLVDTETKPPYKYNINTKALKNGTYTLVSKTIYADGVTKQATQHIVVRNASSNGSLFWVYALLAVIVIVFVWVMFLKRRLPGNPYLGLPPSGPSPLPPSPPVLPGPPTSPKPESSSSHIAHSAKEPPVKPLSHGVLGSTPGPGSVIGPS
jgi:hypothetical protein